LSRFGLSRVVVDVVGGATEEAEKEEKHDNDVGTRERNGKNKN
jgi:hypothetical protein